MPGFLGWGIFLLGFDKKNIEITPFLPKNFFMKIPSFYWSFLISFFVPFFKLLYNLNNCRQLALFNLYNKLRRRPNLKKHF